MEIKLADKDTLHMGTLPSHIHVHHGGMGLTVESPSLSGPLPSLHPVYGVSEDTWLAL